MAEVASRELRNNTRAVLDRVEAGEIVTITVDGRRLRALNQSVTDRGGCRRRPYRAPADELPHDPGLAKDLRELAPDTTDDLDEP